MKRLIIFILALKASIIVQVYSLVICINRILLFKYRNQAETCQEYDGNSVRIRYNAYDCFT